MMSTSPDSCLSSLPLRAEAPLLAVSMGDPAGIGPEILVKAWVAAPELMAHCAVAGDMAVMQRAVETCRRTQPALRGHWPALQQVDGWSEVRHASGHGIMPVVQCCHLASGAVLPMAGEVSAQAGRMAADCIASAAGAVLRGECAALVTAPIHKEALAAAGVPHPGHTEMLQALAAAHTGCAVQDMPVRMMLANPELRTVLNSIHVSLRHAIEAVTCRQVLQTLRVTHDFLSMVLPDCRSGQRKPCIAVAGLNPHAGEGGLFGAEEMEEIAPAVAIARAEGLDVHGPYPPDTVFMQARQGAHRQPPFCDAVIAMYHDQGLIPVKYLGVEEGVNITLGLPLIRTSPDHGTAFNIAGTGRADPASLLAAVRQALVMTMPAIAP